jgi:hypothetical protein
VIQVLSIEKHRRVAAVVVRVTLPRQALYPRMPTILGYPLAAALIFDWSGAHCVCTTAILTIMTAPNAEPRSRLLTIR